MNKALCVGIGNYGDGMSLCCDNDAKCLGELISKNENEKANFNVKYVLNKDATKTKLRRELDELFNSNTRNVIFYFSGHGEQEYGDVYLHLYDGKRGDWGISMTEIIGYANESKCKSKVLIFDCCYSGKIGEVKGFNNNCSILSTGTVIIASSRKCEISRINAAEKNSEFTKLLLEAIS